MNKTERYIIYANIVVSLTLSIISLCILLSRTDSMNYIGVLVGVLSLMVTTLIGWNSFIFESSALTMSDTT